MSSQSKDNTCPTCKGTGHKFPDAPRSCIDCHGSGQQEDTLTSQPPSPQSSPLDNVSESSRTPEWIGANSVFVYSLGYSMIAKAIAPLMEYTNFTKNAKGEYDQQAYLDVINNIEALLRAAETGDDEPDEALSSNNASESVRVDAPLTDSKPEKPHEHQWQTRSNGTFCLGCGGIKLPEDEPSKPDQLDLAQIIIDAGQPWGLDENEAFFDALPAVKEALEALISQREQSAYDRGVKDGKAAGSLAAFLEIKAYGSYALDRQYCDEPFIVVPVSELDEAISVFGDELKSKGEVK